MKTKSILLVLVLVLVLVLAPAFAQSPTPEPSPAAIPVAESPGRPSAQAAMKLPPQTQAAFLAGQIIQQLTNLLNQVSQVIDNGIPAQNGSPEIPAKDLQAALGANNVMRIRSAIAILSEAPSPTPAPEKK